MILIVDDDADSREAMLDWCALEGFPAVGAGSGREALTILHAKGSQVCLVVLDWVLPDLAGPEVLKAIQEGWPGLPVAWCTAKHLKAAAIPYLEKPSILDGLMDLARAHCPRIM